MMTGLTRRYLNLAAAISLTGITQHAWALSLQQAESLALLDDPVINGHLASSRSLQHESAAAATLPDPKFRLGMFNVPLDSFDLEQNPTTQLRLGLQQQFPRGDTLDIKSERSLLQSSMMRSLAEDARRKLLRDLRETYLNLYYETRAVGIIGETLKLFRKLVDITENRYASGSANQQDIISAQLELSRLIDRQTRYEGKRDKYRAELGQWLGEAAQQDIDGVFPELVTPDLGDIEQSIAQHPLIKAQNERIVAARKNTEIAKQDYSPGFNAFFEYRKRFGENADGSDRADMMAAMVTMDIPLFTDDRQDRQVTASEEEVNAARYQRDDKLRTLKRMVEENMSMYESAQQREQLYASTLLAAAGNNSDASLNAYQSGVTEFTTLIRAQITELDVRLDALRVRIDKAIAQARLLYITGE